MRLFSMLITLFSSSFAYATGDSPNASATLTLQREAPPAASIPAPQWYLDDIDFLTRDGGRWVTSNADYMSENEPMESYVIVWEKGYANSMTGRLFAMTDGEETGDFWRFRQYWHAGEGKAVLEQFGFGGAIGLGVIWREDDKMKTVQTFYPPDGATSAPAMQGHIAYNPDANTHVTESYTIADGEWRPNRVYRWRRDTASEETKPDTE
ncbi:hypothetical protein PUV54_13100 [Hyphococcus flavus]|uniref:DUF1579 domain-containing protein n=1 Tax=Hyphococcus flavus TaxID=1866326 RepID=A0AAE9ZHF7_9PROT|nr:hypothetical protein [Hyphococcus flavus]WDI30891.1 hypothetical protein PUV54_13100 [Hyphococcus flavus]